MGTTAFDLMQAEVKRVDEARTRHAELESSMRKLCDEFTELAGKAGIRMTFKLATKDQLLAKDVGVRINITKGYWPISTSASVKIRMSDETDRTNYDYHCDTETGSAYGVHMRPAGFRTGDTTPETNRADLRRSFKDFLFKGVLTEREAEKMQALALKL